MTHGWHLQSFASLIGIRRQSADENLAMWMSRLSFFVYVPV